MHWFPNILGTWNQTLRIRTFALLLAVSLAPNITAAQTEPDESGHVFFAWQGPTAQCFQSRSLEHRVEALLSRSVFRELDVDLRVRGTAERSATGWAIRFTAEHSNGERLGVRVLHQASTDGECQELLGSAAVVLALMIDATSEVHLELPERDESNDGGEAELILPAADTHAVLSVTPAPPRPERELDLSVSLSAGATHGLLPGWSWTIESRTRVHWSETFAIELDFSASLPTTTGPGVGGTFRAFRLRAGPCAELPLTRALYLGGCILLDVGVINGRGQGAEITQEDRRAIIAVTPSARMGLKLGPVEMGLAGNLAVFLLAPSFVFQTPGEDLLIHEVSTLVPAVSFFVGLHTR